MRSRSAWPVLFAAASAAACALWISAGPVCGAETDGVVVRLAPHDLQLKSFNSVSAGTYVRSAARSQTPEGWDTLFVGKLGAVRSADGLEEGGVAVRFLHKGFDRSTFSLWWWPMDGEPMELPRLPETIHQVYVAFGPLKIDGRPKMTVHFHFPLTGVEQWKARPARLIYILPMECLAGEAQMDGRKIMVGLYDRGMNLSHCDFCTTHVHEGDWLLVDGNGDGRFAMSCPGPEVLGMTRIVNVGGRWWRPSVSGTDLLLSPASFETFPLRLVGLDGPCKVTGWSYLTGAFAADLDDVSCVEVPKADFRIYSYVCDRDGYRLIASVGAVGMRKPPDSGVDEMTVGPALRGEILRKSIGDQKAFAFRCLGRAGENVTVFNGKARMEPVFVVTDSQGKELFSKAAPFG